MACSLNNSHAYICRPTTSGEHVHYQKLYIPPLSGSSIPPSLSSPSNNSSSQIGYAPDPPQSPENPQPTCSSNPPNYLTTATASSSLHPSQSIEYYRLQQMYTNPGQLFGEWLSRTQNLGPIPRPLLMWAIGIFDILAVVPLLGLLVYTVFLNPISDDLETLVWEFALCFCVIAAQLVIGCGLLTGLRGSDDCITLRYCNFWICCQCCYLLQSIIVLFAGTASLGSTFFTKMYIAEWFRFVYRVICLIIVIKFKLKLDKAPKVIKDAWDQQQLLNRQEEELNVSSDCSESGENIEMV